MRAAPAYRGKGAGEAILRQLIAEAERRGYTWLGLETGRPEPFLPAASLYRKHGFAECENFGDYVSDEFSLCMSRALSPISPPPRPTGRRRRRSPSSAAALHGGVRAPLPRPRTSRPSSPNTARPRNSARISRGSPTAYPAGRS